MEENALFTAAALSLLVVSALVYLTTVLRDAPFVNISCRILLARLGLAAVAALIVFLLNEVRLAFALASKTLLEVVIVVIIIAVLVGIAIQYLLPSVRDAQRASKITNAALAVARIVSGKPEVALDDLFFLLARGVPPLTDEQLVAIARELNRLAADLGFDAAGVWTWLREQKLHGMVGEALDPLLARIDEALQSPDLSDEDRAALEELKRYIEELKRTVPGAEPAEGDEDQ